MNGDLTLTECEDEKTWNAIVDSSPQASIFQTWAWCTIQELLGDGTKFRPCIATSNGIKYAISVFTHGNNIRLNRFGYGGVAGPAPETLRFAGLKARLAELFHVPLGRALLAPGVALADTEQGRNGWTVNETYTLTVPETFAELLQSAPNARKELRNSARKGITVKDLPAAQWPVVAELENDLLAKHDAGFRIPLEFWLGVDRGFRPAGLELLGAYLGDELVGAALFLHWRSAGYVLINVGTAEGRKGGVGHALWGGCMEKACSLSVTSVDLGGAPTENLVRPKAIWGARPVPYLVFDSSA